MHARPYTAADREPCLAAFDSNIPAYFLPEERIQFAEFLDRLPGPYFVIVDSDTVIACGGYAHGRRDREADLCWTLVHRDHHGRGAGDYLIRLCLDEIAANTPAGTVRLETSQHTRQFFERFGFEAVEIARDGFGPGLDRIEMRRRKQEKRS